jgi:hypothetical protein
MLLTGCGAQMSQLAGVPIVDPTDKLAVAAAIKVETNDATGSTLISAPIIFHDRNVTGNSYKFRSWISDSGEHPQGVFQIVVIAKVDQWMLLRQAFSEGEELATVQMDRDENCRKSGCILTEYVGINLDMAQATGYAQTGITFRVVGVRGHVDMTIPPEYFAAFMEEFAKYKAAQT